MINDANRLLGTWTLQSWTRVGANGALSYPHTEQGSGRLIYAKEGRMAGFLMSPLHLAGTSSEGQPQFVAYSGRFEVVDGIANHHVDFASDIRMMSKILRRRLHWLSADDLKLETLSPAGGSDRESTHFLLWRRTQG